MTIKEMKTTWQDELMAHIKQARAWRDLWLGDETDMDKVRTYQSLMDTEKSKAYALLSLARKFEWITEGQRTELCSDMLDAIFDD